MRCPNCGYDNPQGRRYCEDCGEKLTDLEARKARARRRSQREAAIYRREAQRDGLDAEEAERRRRRTRRRTSPWVALLILAVLVAVIVIIILVASGGESGPEKAVKEFYNAIKDKDVMTYLNHTELELYKMAERGEYQPDPYTEGIDYDSYLLEGLTTRLVKEEGDYAEVEVTGGYFEGMYNDGSTSGGIDFSQHPRLVTLVKVEDTWIVQDYQIMKLPYLFAEIGPEQPEFPEVEEPI
ncbi:MAG: zinc ribbon domain-containing protein [Actinobacteria bacterium]|nr:MAG: zinc ribbon domain-containing protein [Actinomycetota bacterium]